MKDHLESYFKFSKKELNGIVILFLLVVAIFALPEIFRVFEKPVSYDHDEFKKEIASFKASVSNKKYTYSRVRDEVEDKEFKAEYFDFDPNTISDADLQKLGLSAKQAKVIVNYRSKGGKFYKREDLKKIYSIKDKQYQNLEPYIKIIPVDYKTPKYSRTPEYKKRSEESAREINVIELNSADSAALISINGIGPAFASRIIRFRNRLGGFNNKEQLKEVYGLDSVKYEKIHEKVKVDVSQVQKININSATFNELKKHPYLNYKQMNAILQYRKQHGSYKSPDDLRQVLILNEEIIRKIEPYLSF